MQCKVDDCHIFICQRVAYSGCCSALPVLQIADAKRGAVGHKAVPCKHDALIVNRGQNSFLIGQRNDSEPGLPVRLRPALGLVRAWNRQRQNNIRMIVSETDGFLRGQRVKAPGASADEPAVASAVGFADASENHPREPFPRGNGQCPVPGEKGCHSDALRRKITCTHRINPF